MKLTQLIDWLTSGLTITDSGLGATRVHVSESLKKEYSAMRRSQRRFRKCLLEIRTLGAKISEPDGPELIDDKHSIGFGFVVSGVDGEASSLVLKAIELGYYYGCMHEGFHSSQSSMLRSFTAKTEAGPAGGRGKKARADRNHAAILVEYAKWAKQSRNADKSTKEFATWLRKEKAERGFSASTIQEVVRRFHESIMEKRPRRRPGVSAGDSLRVAIDHVCKQMAGRPGINEHTVRRALR
jgi:hypothetical protein